MKVFLSSTAQDLDAYRKVADETIRRLGLQGIAMEFFGPLTGTPIEECEKLARETDVVVCVVAHRYGSVPEKGQGSFTRREVEAAKNANKDVLVWIVDESFPWTEKKEQDLLVDPNVLADPERVKEVAEHVAALIDFKAWLRTTFTPDTFTTLDNLGNRIATALANYVVGHSAPPLPQDRISIARLPTSGAELFGREAELQILDAAWSSEKTNIVSFVAWGGVGKTALVNHWLKKRMARDNYRGTDRVYGWSFFSQGTSERAASADLFIDKALRWCGDKDPTAGSPWDKGERLANYLRQSRTLLILDGLEPLQHPPGPQEGRLKDAAMQALLVELAAHQPGLCVISTRERIGDLIEFEASTVVRHDLEHLSPQAGAQILRSFNVKGDDEELEAASAELGGHAFALTLLGSYLNEVFEGDIRRRKEIENLFDDTRYGERAQAMIGAYEKWLGEGMELAILRLLGFFDRPADAASINALREPPTIPELTEPLQHFKAREWSQAVAKLRRIKLLAEALPNELVTLDAHPLLREHFKQQLKRDRPNAWSEGNDRLYRYLESAAKEFPDTIEEMSPLFAAVAHGCAAGKYQQAIEIFWTRIRRRSADFSNDKLGAWGADLAVMSNFFERAWDEPVGELQDYVQSYVLAEAGRCLRALGRLQGAAQPMRMALQAYIGSEQWSAASTVASNLTELCLVTGELSKALDFGAQAVELADRSPDEFQQMGHRTSLATAYHQSGQYAEAAVAFTNAEERQRKRQPEYQTLYSLQGFRYNEFLLDGGQSQSVKERARTTLEGAKKEGFLLDIGLDNLSLGKAFLWDIKNNTSDSGLAAGFIKTAVRVLRDAGQVDYLPLGLLARAELHRFNRDYIKAEYDLSETYRIASRSGMNLHLADYHLESARLRLAQGDNEKAREHSTTAKGMINRMGYHRRDKEVEEIEKQLAN